MSADTLTEKFEKDYIPLGSATGEVSLAVADFDSDGKYDGVAAIDSRGGRVMAFSFSGLSQIWTVSKPNIVEGTSNGAIIAADLDGDSKSSDIIAGARGIFAINAGTVIWNYTTSDSIYSLALADLNEDGKTDEIVAGGHGNVYAVDSSGALLWKFSDPSAAIETIAGIDFDKNGVPESVLIGSAKSLYVLDSDGNRLWSRIASDNVYSVVSVDFDNDGYLTDIAYGAGDGNVTALNSEGTGLWDYRAYVTPGEKIKLYAADLSSTGIFDKVIVNADSVHGLNSVGTRAWGNTFIGDSATLVDFNGDGNKEGVVIGTSRNIYGISALGQEVGYYLLDDGKKKKPYNITGASVLSAADLDGDGYLDDIFGVTSGAYFALAHTTDAPAPATTPPPTTTASPVTTAPPTPGEVTVNLGDDRTVAEGTVVTLTAEATPSLPTGKIITYVWTEGTDLLTTETDKKSLGKIFEVGEHTIKVVATDDTGASAYDTVKVTVTAQETPVQTPAPAEQTNPLLMVFLGVAIGIAIVGAILYFMKKKEPQDEWD
ncbi:MAG: PKD domain-containing protein [Planctomycetota bacterium]